MLHIELHTNSTLYVALKYKSPFLLIYDLKHGEKNRFDLCCELGSDSFHFLSFSLPLMLFFLLFIQEQFLMKFYLEEEGIEVKRVENCHFKLLLIKLHVEIKFFLFYSKLIFLLWWKNKLFTKKFLKKNHKIVADEMGVKCIFKKWIVFNCFCTLQKIDINPIYHSVWENYFDKMGS